MNFVRIHHVELVLIIAISSITCLTANKAVVPPKIVSHPPREVAYKLGERVELPCVATGDPTPEYRWTRSGYVVRTDGDVEMMPDVGTIVIQYPNPRHEGIYQCTAKNEFGIAISSTAMLKMAVMEPFPSTGGNVPVHHPKVGQPLTLKCASPNSYPKGIMSWALVDAASDVDKSLPFFKSSEFFQPLPLDARVAVDYSGSLHFANVIAEDAHLGHLYGCTLYNYIFRGFVQGDDQVVSPELLPGSLYFANVMMSDRREGKMYVCNLQNTALRTFSQGGDQIIIPRPMSEVAEEEQETGSGDADDQPGSPAPAPVKVMWHSESPSVVLTGSFAAMKCIFAGYPTPKVSWQRVGGTMPDRATVRSAGLELVIPNVVHSDSGVYRCSAFNTVKEHSVSVDIKLDIQSLPFFKTKPKDVYPLEGDDAEFHCEADGSPKPSVKWTINGKPIEELSSDSQHTLSADGRSIYYKNVVKESTQVLQCNASNIHGYVFENAILNVISLPPEITTVPVEVTTQLEGTELSLSCAAAGAPKPTLAWKVGEDLNDITEDDRISVLTSGNETSLSIKNAAVHDSGTYYCAATNKYGDAKAMGTIVIKQRTSIADPPSDLSATAGTDVTLSCGISVDPSELATVTVTWTKDDAEILLGDGTRFTHDPESHSLRISPVVVDDSGVYKCHVKATMDEADAQAVLLIKDRPEPPTNVRLTCDSREIKVNWEAGSDNNDPITLFTIFFASSHDKDNNDEHEVTSTDHDSSVVSFDAEPITEYAVSVVADNSIGRSDRSATVTCKTKAALPTRHPDGVCLENGAADELTVVWKALPKSEHLGESLHYVVSYSSRDGTVQQKTVNDWQQQRLVISGLPTFTAFEVSVQAVNEAGSAPDNSLHPIVGYTGEGVPQDKPGSVTVNDDTLNATSATVSWLPIDESPERVQGHLRGYRVIYWQAEEPNTRHSVDHILHSEVSLCRPVGAGVDGERKRRDVEPLQQLISNLKPYTDYEVSVSVLTLTASGPLSDPIAFKTFESVPGPVPPVSVTEKASHHLIIEWAPPEVPNGIIRGYVVEYGARSKDETESDVNKITIDDPAILQLRLTELQPATDYVLRVWAFTFVGNSYEASELLTRTVDNIEPDIPVLNSIDTQPTHANVSWLPNSGSVHNPGVEFFVEYRKQREDSNSESELETENDVVEAPWLKTDAETNRHWINITDLEDGFNYEFRVVSVSGGKKESRSPVVVQLVGAVRIATKSTTSETSLKTTTPVVYAETGAPVVASASSPVWIFILLAVVLLMLLLGVAIAVVMRRNRGQKYPVHEKERLHGHDLGDEEKHQFGEYDRSVTKNGKGDHGLLIGGLPADSDDEADNDSMEDYSQMDPTKFNEDGSFIGQYGGHRRGVEVDASSHSPQV